MKFNSQICTSREQSERLLALGLKKETADMCHTPFRSNFDGTLDYTEHCSLPLGKDIPAWSLHRLIEMCPYYIEFLGKEWVLMVNHSDIQYKVTGGCSYIGSFIGADLYTNLIDCIEWLIKERYFNKEYLEER